MLKKLAKNRCTFVHAIPYWGDCPGEVRPYDMMECHLASVSIRHDMIAHRKLPMGLKIILAFM